MRGSQMLREITHTVTMVWQDRAAQRAKVAGSRNHMPRLSEHLVDPLQPREGRQVRRAALMLRAFTHLCLLKIISPW